MIPKSLAECQDWVAAHCHRDYYATTYRAMENDYLPHLCKILEESWSLDPGEYDSLEVGPGWGTMAVWLASRGWDVKLADLVPFGHYITRQFVAALEEEFDCEVGFRQYDICGEPMDLLHTNPGYKPDLVLMTQVLPHLKWSPIQAIKNLAAMTHPYGMCVLTALDRTAYPQIIPPYEHWYQVPGSGEPCQETVVTMYDEADLKRLVEIGFGDIKVYRPERSSCLFAECRKPQF